MTNTLYNIYTRQPSGSVVKTNRLARMSAYNRRAIYAQVQEGSKALFGQTIFWNADGTEGVAMARGAY